MMAAMPLSRISTHPDDAVTWLGCLGRWCAKRPWRIVAAWALALILATAANSALGGTYSDNFTLPSSPSEQGAALLKAHDRGQGGQGGQLVFTVRSGTLDPDRPAIEQAVTAMRATPHVLSASDPFGSGSVSANGRTAVATVHFDTNPQQLGPSYVAQINRALTPARAAGVTVDYGGALGKAATPKSKDTRSALIGIVAALIVLLVGFGSVYAAGVPLVSAGVGAVTGIGILGAVAASSTFPTVSPTFALMMGLGVGIDYTLFLATRHRQRLIDGADPVAAAGDTLATSGRAVLVAAMTVVVALVALYASGMGFMGQLGLAGAIGVAIAALAALTLGPALLGLLGRRIDRRRVRTPVAESTSAGAGWGRYARRVGAHPWRYLLSGACLVGVLAIPFFSMRLGHVDAGADPTNDTAKRAYDAISTAFGPGANGPFTIAVSLAPGTSGAQVAALEAKLHGALAATPDVAKAGPVHPNRSDDVLVATVVPRSSPQAAATDTLQARLRDTTLPGALAGSRAKGYVTGSTSEALDFRNQISSRLPVIVAVVVAIAFLILVVSFRSPILALKAAVLNLLSIGAAYGVIVAVFQWGWGGSLFGVSHTIPIESYVPMMMFAIVFGLSMDYEVFLLSRVREVWLRTGDNHESVAAGLAATARVITCAALIMTTVFLAFLLSSNIVVKMLALGLGASILIDATIIRLVVVPAAMFLIGDYNWWTPQWLDRLLSRGHRGAPRWRGRRHGPRRLAGVVAAALGAVVLALFAVTFLVSSSAGSQTKGGNKRSGGIAATVGVSSVKDAVLSSQVTLAGTVGGSNGTVSLTPQTAGTVSSLSISVGQNVTAGQAVAQVSATQAAGAKQAAVQLTVTAPVAGTIGQILVPVGGYASPTNPIATLTGSTDTLTAQATPFQVSTLDGRIGAKSTASLAVPGATHGVKATLTSIAPIANATTQQTAVTFSTTTALQFGAPVSITVELPQPRRPVVPADAVVDAAGKEGVYVATDIVSPTALGVKLPANVPAGTSLGRATFTPVTTGVTENGSTQVLSGLRAGQTVVTTGQSNLTGLSGAQRVAILGTGAASSRSKSATAAGGSKAAARAASGIDVTLVAIHGSTLTVSTPIGQKSFTVPAGFSITRDGTPIQPSQLHAGDVLKVTFKRTNGKPTPVSAVLQ